ncbi:MAG: phosphoribosyltransferase family protein [Dehalococcoidales bacterium]|nr:phosphoribosyltransferase family protein [Dehalococcoidales bacterium]
MGKLTIISRSSELFKDRREAGWLLGRELAKLQGKNAVVLGIPRGGIIVGCELARELEADLDIVLSRKLRTPGQLELAMGSVAEDGKVFLNESVVREFGVSEDFIRREKEYQLAEIVRRREFVRQFRPKVPLKDRMVIVTDDGVATGATMQAALWAARQEQPQKLIAALPVGSEETVRRLAADVDEMVCLRAPPVFYAVGQFYARFDQVEDEDVIEVLRAECERAGIK